MNQNENFINGLFKAAGLESEVRNFLVDYRDDKGNSFHKPLQTLCVGSSSDEEIVTGIFNDLKKENMTVCGITEIFGTHALNELERMAGDITYLSASGFKFLYLENKKAIN